MITLTTEQAQQIEEELKYTRNVCVGSNWSTDATDKALATLRAARARAQAEHERKYSKLADTNNWTTPNFTDEQWQKLDREYQDHLVNQSFDWAAMAAKHQFMEGYRIGLAEMREKCAKVMESGVLGHGECAAAIRAINFEGDTGFRPVSEMIAEQEPVGECEVYIGENGEANFDSFRFTLPKHFPSGSYKLYAHPVRTKDLTDDEIDGIANNHDDFAGRIKVDHVFDFARAIIATDREKNNANNNT